MKMFKKYSNGKVIMINVQNATIIKGLSKLGWTIAIQIG